MGSTPFHIRIKGNGLFGMPPALSLINHPRVLEHIPVHGLPGSC